mgnify:CR=1 FL=1
MTEQSPIPKEELELFKQLKDLKVIFDAGARTDIDYLEIWPESEHHLFEPNPEFVKELRKKIKNNPNVFINEFGLGDKQEKRGYQTQNQAFIGTDNVPNTGTSDLILPLKTLDWYVKTNNIKQIDFLKLDTEGYEFRAILGAKKTLKNVRFIQYECWSDAGGIRTLLRDRFHVEDIGYRNSLAINYDLVDESERLKLVDYIVDNRLCKFK